MLRNLLYSSILVLKSIWNDNRNCSISDLSEIQVRLSANDLFRGIIRNSSSKFRDVRSSLGGLLG